ncbi:hypothetical protein [Ammoniphilus sp. 3BR4]|uniref:hypothetical protein n=1 Tax=Ammoniphilus sp. 3BR4 TaxID=3158265 RepID=UPI003464F7A2
MNEKGSMYLEVMLAWLIFSLLLLPLLSLSVELSRDSSTLSQRSEAYWAVTRSMEKWKKGMLSMNAETQEKIRISLTERNLSEKVMEGEFRVEWNSPKGAEEWIVYAYKQATPSLK